MTLFITDRKPGRGRNVVGDGKKWKEGAKRRAGRREPSEGRKWGREEGKEEGSGSGKKH